MPRRSSCCEGDGLSPDSAFSVQDGEVVLDVVPLIVQTVELMQERGIISDRFDLTEIAQNVTSNEKVQPLARDIRRVGARGFRPDRGPRFGDKVSEVCGNAVHGAASARHLPEGHGRPGGLGAGVMIGGVAGPVGRSTPNPGAVEHRHRRGRHPHAHRHRPGGGGHRQRHREGRAQGPAVQMTESLTEMLARTLMTLAIVGLAVGLIAYLLKPAADGGDSWLTGIVRDHGDIARVAVVGVCLALLFAVGLELDHVHHRRCARRGRRAVRRTGTSKAAAVPS